MPTISPQVTPYYGGGQVVNPANVLQVNSTPSTVLTEDKLGTIAVENSSSSAWMLVSKSGGVNTWAQIVSSGGDVSSVTGTSGQITASPTTGAVVLSLPSALVAPGSVTATTSLTATLGNITATNGNLVMSTAGNKLVIPATSSATCSAGTFTLGGTATTVVSNSAVTASSLIFLQTAALGTVSAASTLAVTAKSAGTSFTVTPSQSTDTSTVNYLIIN